MKKLLIILAIVLLGWALSVQAEKYDGDCTGTETVGRCADKYIPHTPTGCPYGDSIPLDSPKCVPEQSWGK